MNFQKKPRLHIKALLLFMALLPAFISCDSDDETSTVNNITMDGEPFTVHSASLIGVSMDGEGHAAVNLVNTDGSVSKSLSIDFEYSPNASVSGTYSFPQEGTDRYLDDWLTNYSVMSHSGGSSESTNLLEGTVTVKDNGGSNYTVTVDLKMVDGQLFKGTYQGKMQAMFNNS